MKILTGILAGLRRAFPYAKETLKREADAAKTEKGEEEKGGGGGDEQKKKKSRLPTPGARLFAEIDALFKAVHTTSNFLVSVRALTVLEQVADCHGEYADR